MANQTLNLTPELHAYLQAVSVREPAIFQQVRTDNAKMRSRDMQCSPEQGQFMALLVKLLQAKSILEIGTYIGYSTMWFASALPDDGKVITCDINQEWTHQAKQYWQAAGLQNKIELKLAPALQTLHELLAQGYQDSFDICFIDADKSSYDNYYELALQLTKKNGLILIDNVLWYGKVLDSEINDKDTRAIRALNKKLLQDQRIAISMLPIGDGLTLANKR